MLAQHLIRLAKGNFYRSAILLMFTTSLLACWVSNTSSTAMMLPLALGMLGLIKRETVSAEAKFLLLGTAYSASIGGVVTMISSPPNAIGASILGMTFSQWLMYSIPVYLLTFPLMVLLLTLYFKPDKKISLGVMVFKKRRDAPMIRLAAIFFFTAALWTLEGVLSPMLKLEVNFNSTVAVLAVILLLLFRVLSFKEVIRSVEWEILILFAGGLTLGMLIEKSGLGALMVTGLSSLLKAIPIFFFLLLIITFTITLTEFMSNTASAAMLVPLLYSLCIQMGIDPVILVLPATIATSYGFMLPVGTPPNAIVFSTGLIPQREMLRIGIVINILFAVLLTTFFYLIFY